MYNWIRIKKKLLQIPDVADVNSRAFRGILMNRSKNLMHNKSHEMPLKNGKNNLKKCIIDYTA